MSFVAVEKSHLNTTPLHFIGVELWKTMVYATLMTDTFEGFTELGEGY